jgi:phage gp29-like protein
MTITLLGPDGRPLDLKAALRRLDDEPQTAKIGTIAREFGRHPARGLTPARLAQLMDRAEEGDLARQAELAADMVERDAHLYAELSKRRLAITALDWSIEEPDGATPEEQALTERVREWVSLVSCEADGEVGDASLMLWAMTSAVLPGYAPIELVWRLVRDSRGREVRVPHGTLQPQNWFTLSPDRRRFLLRSNDKMVSGSGVHPPVMGEELRPLAWLMHVHPATNGYLARTPLARVLFWPYLFKHYAVRDFSEFLEIYGLPLRVGRYPSGSTDDEKRALLRAVTEIGHNAAGIIPQGMALEFQSAAAGTEVPFTALWDRLDAAQSKAILGQTLSSSEGQHGTQALGQVHNEVRLDLRDADARRIEASFTRQLIAPLVLLNEPGANPRRLPRLVIDTSQAEDLAAYAEQLPKLAASGLRIGVKWVHKKLRIPEPEQGEQTLGAAPPPVPPGGTAAQPPAPGPAQPASARRQDAMQRLAAALLRGAPAPAAAPAAPDLVDEAVADLARQWQPVLGPLVQRVLAELDQALAGGESVEAFAARVHELVPLMDAQAATELLARAAYSARLAGEADIDLAADGENEQPERAAP